MPVMISYDISYVHACIRFAGLPEGRTYVELLNKVWICTSNILSNYYRVYSGFRFGMVNILNSIWLFSSHLPDYVGRPFIQALDKSTPVLVQL